MDHERDIKTEPATGIEFSTTELEYLAAIQQLLQEQAQEAEPKPVRIIDVANKLGHDRSKANYWIKKLQAKDVLEVTPKTGVITLKDDALSDNSAADDLMPMDQKYLAAIRQLLQEQAQEAEPKPVRIIDVAKKLGKNRSTVWSGVKRLEARGLLVTEPKKGTITLPNDAKE